MTGHETAPGVSATSSLRLWGYGVVLAVIAFVQSPGSMVADTKFDLVVDPWGFLARAAHMWDAQAAFGQVQNQAYGYFWPMGPFFGVGHTAHVPEWVVQRLWWTLLLCLAFFGILRLCRTMGVGRPWTQVVAAFAFALSPHLVTLLGATSVEAWPTALAPWVLVPLVRATEGGSVRRQAALSALVVACCGGVNAVAVSAVLPLGALWIWTRSSGPRRRRLFGWWAACVVLATLWWLVPLLLMGSYAAPFLDYIESAPITTQPTGLLHTLSGTADWVAYVAADVYPAGHQIATTAFLVLDAAVVVGLGLAGIARRDNPHRRFLLAGVVVGALLVGFGYTGELHGWYAEPRQDLLDAALAPFRNLHKYDVVLRIPLVLGLAHLLERLQAAAGAPEAHVEEHHRHARPAPAGTGSRIPALVTLLTALIAMLGLGVPWYSGVVAPRGGVVDVPDYWRQAARYLAAEDDGTVSLEVPASSFGDYLWGRPHDDILQSLADSPWAVRNVVPLAEPGNVVFLDAVTEAVEAGRPNSALAQVLAANGIGRLVVRNDLDRLVTGSPDPAVLHQALTLSRGLERVKTFGPPVGEPAFGTAPNGTRLLTHNGLSASYPAIEVFDVEPTAAPAVLVSGQVPAVLGDPGSLLRAPGFDALPYASPTVLAGDLGDRRLPVLLTDGLRYREKAFAAVRRNESATHPAETHWLLPAVVPNHQIYDDQRRWSTTETVQGVESVEASSSQADADAPPPLAREHLPFAALDGSVATSWRSALGTHPEGQSWSVRLGTPRPLPMVSVTMGRSTGRVVQQLTFRSGDRVKTVAAPAPGRTREYWLGWPPSDELAVTASRAADAGQFAIAEVALPGVGPRRYLRLPDPPADQEVSGVLLTRDQGVSSCFRLVVSLVCDDRTGSTGEDGDWLNRIVTLPAAQTYTAHLRGSARPGRQAVSALRHRLPVRVVASSRTGRELGESALATVDGDPGTTWLSSPRDPAPSLRVTWRHPVVLRQVRLAVDDQAAASAPSKVMLVWGTDGLRSRTVKLDRYGQGTIPPVRVRSLTIVIQAWHRAYSVEGQQFQPLRPGVSELEFNGRDDLSGEQAARPLVIRCGDGPLLSVGGTEIPTRASTTVAALMSGDPVTLHACGSDRVDLSSGENLLSFQPSALLRVDAALLDLPGTSPPEVVRPPTTRWDPDQREVRLPDRGGESLLVVQENENAGWHATLGGKELQAQRVDGWKQGWWVPAGDAATVELRYAPQRTYQWAMAAGPVGVLAVLALALWRRSDRSAGLPPLRTAEGATVVDGLLLVGAAGLLAGWAGAAIAALCVAGSLLLPPARDWAGQAAGLMVLAAGALTANDATRQEWAGLVQGLVAGALCLSFLALRARGPLFFNRSAGRSSQ